MPKMKYLTLTMLLILLAVMCPGCASNEAGPEQVNETPKAGEITTANETLSGEALYAYVTEENNYKNWKLWPGTGELAPGKGPHGDLITIYVSDNALSAIEGKAGVMPENSTVVKEGHDSNGELKEVVVMHKVAGFDPKHNDWYWAEYDASGKVLAEGKELSCYNCHTRAASNDYLFTGNLK